MNEKDQPPSLALLLVVHVLCVYVCACEGRGKKKLLHRVKMERLIVRFAKGLPRSITRRRQGAEGFIIPKAKRLSTLRFMTQQPQHVIKKKKSSWEVIGIFPHRENRRQPQQQQQQQQGGGNYSAYVREVKKALSLIPSHAFSKLSTGELKENPKIKELYQHHFESNPELINYPSIVNVIASNLLNYDSTTGAVRDSIADVRQKRELPTSTIPLEIARENEFDRLLLLTLDRFLAQKNIPSLFLKSNYFTLRPQLYQAYQEDPTRFRGKLEQVGDRLEAQVWVDYSTLVNESNRIYLSRYPFEEATRVLGLSSRTSGFAGITAKLQAITRSSRAVPGSSAKFAGGLEELSQTFASSPEAKLVSLGHFMRGLQSVMNDDESFVRGVLKNGSRTHAKVISILQGKSI